MKAKVYRRDFGLPENIETHVGEWMHVPEHLSEFYVPIPIVKELHTLRRIVNGMSSELIEKVVEEVLEKELAEAHASEVTNRLGYAKAIADATAEMMK